MQKYSLISSNRKHITFVALYTKTEGVQKIFNPKTAFLIRRKLHVQREGGNYKKIALVQCYGSGHVRFF